MSGAFKQDTNVDIPVLISSVFVTKCSSFLFHFQTLKRIGESGPRINRLSHALVISLGNYDEKYNAHCNREVTKFAQEYHPLRLLTSQEIAGVGARNTARLKGVTSEADKTMCLFSLIFNNGKHIDFFFIYQLHL